MKAWCVLLFLTFAILSDLGEAKDIRNAKECNKQKGVCKKTCPPTYKNVGVCQINIPCCVP